MEHLSQLEQKATTSVSRREHKGPREDKVTKRESLGSFSMRDKSWRTGSPEMWVLDIIKWGILEACSWFFCILAQDRTEGVQKGVPWMFFSLSAAWLSPTPVCLNNCFLSHWHQFPHLYKKNIVQEFTHGQHIPPLQVWKQGNVSQKLDNVSPMCCFPVSYK